MRVTSEHTVLFRQIANHKYVRIATPQYKHTNKKKTAKEALAVR